MKMDYFELMVAQLLLHLLPECVESCDDYCEILFIKEQWPMKMQQSCLLCLQQWLLHQNLQVVPGLKIAKVI